MRDYKIYVCELCGQEFPRDFEKCLEHEKTHVKPESYAIKDKGIFCREGHYPSEITIPMEDGREVIYAFSSIVPIEKERPLATGNSEED